jgi:hypothetical protein
VRLVDDLYPLQHPGGQFQIAAGDVAAQLLQ